MHYYNKLLFERIDSVIAGTLKFIKPSCSLDTVYRINDPEDIFHDISGVYIDANNLYTFSDLGAILRLHFGNASRFTGGSVAFEVLQAANKDSKIDYEEVSYDHVHANFFVSREDLHSLQIHFIDKNEFFCQRELDLPLPLERLLSFNKGIEAFTLYKEELFLFPEYGFLDENKNIRSIYKIRPNAIDAGFSSFNYCLDSNTRVTSAVNHDGTIYVTEIDFDQSKSFYSLVFKAIDINELTQYAGDCYFGSTIAKFYFNTTQALETYIGNFEASAVDVSDQKLTFYLFSDDNNGVYGEFNDLLVITCDL